MTDITYAQVWADHIISVGEPGETITVKVLSGDTVYYGDPNVSASTNLGSITSGSSATMTNPVSWLRSASQSYVQITGQVASSGSGSSSSSSIDADPAQANGATDNTSYLAGLLATAIAAGATLRIPRGVASWVLSKLVLPSNSVVNATGATFIQASGTNTRMILNTSLTLGTPGSARDTNISWTGGTFVKDTGQTNVGSFGATGTGLDDHTTMFGFVDGLTVRNITIQQSGTGGDAGTGGRYGCYVWNCTNFLFDTYTANSSSLAVNQSTLQFAYCSQGHVRGVYGSFGDDMVAIVNGARAADLLANGFATTENITVEDVFGTSPSTGVKLMPGSTATAAPFYNVQRCRVSNVRGSFGSRGGTGAIYIGGSSGTYPNLESGFIQDVEVQNVTQTRASTPAVYMDGFADSHRIVLRAVNNQQDSAAIVFPELSTSHHSLKVADCEFTTAITSGSYFPIVINGATTVRLLELENCRLNAATTGTATVGLVQAVTGPGWLSASNCSCTGKATLLGTITTVCRINGRALEQEDASGLGWFITNTGAVVTVVEWTPMPLAGTNSFTQTAGTIAVKNGAPLPGASGTVALVAGTVTVNTGSGMATSSSQIRLTNIATGGTVGAVAVSSRGANTFTITSTNAADTSTIFWEVVNS